MFIDLGLVTSFNIDYSTLCRWLLTVKRNYRNETVQYHNWYHAFNVTQMMFCTITKTKWNQLFAKVSLAFFGMLTLIVRAISQYYTYIMYARIICSDGAVGKLKLHSMRKGLILQLQQIFLQFVFSIFGHF